jgi:hypothetical protein
LFAEAFERGPAAQQRHQAEHLGEPGGWEAAPADDEPRGAG